jgi:hypothetical protein
MSFPVVGICLDQSAALYIDEVQLTTTIGQAQSLGQPITGYFGMRLIDHIGCLFEVVHAASARDLGPLYPGWSLGRFLFRTRRLQADLALSFIGQLSVPEARHLINEALPSLLRLDCEAGIEVNPIESSLAAATSFPELFRAIKAGIA